MSNVAHVNVPCCNSSLILIDDGYICREAKTSPTIEQLTRSHFHIPVLVYERVKIAQYLRYINRYKRKLIFVGKLDVLGILLTGFTGYWYLVGTKYHSYVLNGLLNILTTAQLDDRLYHIIDWGHRKGQLFVYVSKRPLPNTYDS
jgi:hypothetical protein